MLDIAGSQREWAWDRIGIIPVRPFERERHVAERRSTGILDAEARRQFIREAALHG